MSRYLIFISFLFLAMSLRAQSIYVSSIQGGLFRLDIESCTYDFVTHVQSEVFDISFHPNGNLYGISGEGVLYEIDTLSGAISVIHQFRDQWFNSLTIARDGRIYATGSGGDLWSYDLESGVETNYGNFGYSATGDLTFYDGHLYVAISLNRIVLINLEDPSTSRIVIDEREATINGQFTGSIIGIVSFAEDCSEIRTYAISYTLNSGASHVYQINFEDQSLQFVCELGFEAGGGASTFEFFASSPLSIENIQIENPDCGVENGSIAISATGGSGIILYSLDGDIFQEDSRFDNVTGGVQHLHLSDETGCTIDTTVTINSIACPIYIPSAFSPNQDGINDVFRISPHPGFSGQIRQFRIYNRWGKLVYGMQDFYPSDFVWDGTHHNRVVEEGVYVYIGEYILEDGSSEFLKGSITVIR